MAAALPDFVADADEASQPRLPASAEQRPEPAPLRKPAAAEPAPGDRPRSGAEVVQLDRFRKK
jgi:hypothetical protein